MLVFQPLQSGGRDVVLEERRCSFTRRFSERAFCSHLAISEGSSRASPRELAIIEQIISGRNNGGNSDPPSPD
jgi:hypothetical protein